MTDKEIYGLMNNLTEAVLSIAQALDATNERLKAIEKAIKKIDNGVI